MPLTTHATTAPATGYALVLHAGAGGRLAELTREQQAHYADGLRAAYAAGEAVLSAGGAALDAVCATVRSLEDNELFNAGRGATLTAAGTAELDACVATGDGRNGAVTVNRHTRNTVDLARAVMERTRHVLLVEPPESLAREAGLETVPNEYFITDARRRQLANLRGEAPRHGTVGAVALDAAGHLAAATSTGGMLNKMEGRVGDTPIVGAGTFCRDGVVGVSCTGDGEAFIEGVVAHDVYARMAYGREPLDDAIAHTLTTEVAGRSAEGGLIALAADGSAHLAFNSAMMFAAFRDGDRVETWC